MKSLLILTDFSEAAFRAAEYACGITALLRVERIILYHAYQTILAGTEIPIIQDTEQAHLEGMQSLGLQHDRIRALVDPSITIELVAEEAVLGERIQERARQEDVAAIVMGVSGKSGLDQILMGSMTSQLLKISDVPVLIVPQNALIGRPVNTIVFATGLKDIEQVSGAQLSEFLDAFKAQLYVVNVLPESEEEYSQETLKAITDLHRLLEKYQPTFGYITRDDIVDGILSYADERGASLIIAVPKKHGFFSSLFHKSISKKLAYNSDVPLLFMPGIH